MRCSHVFEMLLFAAVSSASHHPKPQAEKRQESPTASPTSDINWGGVSSALHSYAGSISVSPMFPRPTVTLGVSIPASLRNEIITAVPASVIIQLMMNSDYRESVASDFKAGKTPEWYKDLRPELKTFFENMAASIADGEAVITRTSTPLLPTEQPEDDHTAAENNPDPTSTGEGGAQPTGVDRKLLAGMVGMAGVFGLALAL